MNGNVTLQVAHLQGREGASWRTFCTGQISLLHCASSVWVLTWCAAAIRPIWTTFSSKWNLSLGFQYELLAV